MSVLLHLFQPCSCAGGAFAQIVFQNGALPPDTISPAGNGHSGKRETNTGDMSKRELDSYCIQTT
ncbi:MAG: hypothetical protein WCQ57_05230 [Verrucomicrobiota bacterium]